MLDGLTIPNGIGWSPDGSTMYLVDSGPRVVHAFDFDGERGTFAGRRDLIAVAEHVGAPDGLTVDAAGDLWVAIYGGGRVHRYSPDGVLREEWIVPDRADAPAAHSLAPACTACTSRPRPRAGPTSSAGPSPVPGSSTDSTPMPPAARLHHSSRSSTWWTTTVGTTCDPEPELETPHDQ